MWTKVEAKDPPLGRCDHSATMDGYKRLWVFGGYGSRLETRI